MRIIFKNYDFVRENFNYSFEIIDFEGNRVKKSMSKFTKINKVWKKLSFEFENDKGPVSLILFAETKKLDENDFQKKMFWTNIGHIGIFDSLSKTNAKTKFLVDINLMARFSFLEKKEEEKIFIDLFLKSNFKPSFQKLQRIMLVKNTGQFVYNIYFKDFIIKNLKFEPDEKGCETFKVWAITQQGYILKNESDLSVCREGIRPIVFSGKALGRNFI